MAWYPIGPDFVFVPRDINFKRLSVRNEWLRQGLVNSIAIDPTDPNTIYVAETPTSGGRSAFRTTDGGRSWTPIVDVLQQGNPSFAPNVVIVDPVNTSIIYIATNNFPSVVVQSSDKGSTWRPATTVPGAVRKLVLDPNTAGSLTATTIYAQTDNGIYRSTDSGQTWGAGPVLNGFITSFIAVFPAGGTAAFYAAVRQSGIFYSTNPTAIGNWTNLNNQGIGLPPYATSTTQPDGNFYLPLLDYCPRNPTRIYAWIIATVCDSSGANCVLRSAALYTTNAATTAWSPIAMTSPPDPAYFAFYDMKFAVAPNSPGDGLNDILFFGNIGIHRSTDSGRTWHADGPSTGALWSHADHHEFQWLPANPPAGTVPILYIGNDGGIGCNTVFANPAFNPDTAPEQYNEGDVYLPNACAIQNLNHGRQNSAVYQYAGVRGNPSLGYIGCQDTGVSSSDGSLGWRGVSDADGGPIAAAPGTDSVTIWGNLGEPFSIDVWKDHGSYSTPYIGQATLGSGGPALVATSNFEVDLNNKCLAGIRVLDANTTLANAVGATGVQTATPASMNGIFVGSVLTISSAMNSESVTVTAVTATTFTGNFVNTYPAGATIVLNRSYVVVIDTSGLATAISQNFGTPSVNVHLVAFHPSDPNILVAVTSDNRLWITNSGATANSGTVWAEVVNGKPAGLPAISSMAIDISGNIYVLLNSSVSTGGEFGITSPLFQITGMSWIQLQCNNLPAGYNYGNLLADPAVAGFLYASAGGAVYQLQLAAGSWGWRDISQGLPGGLIYDLWVANFGTSASPVVVLRAAIPTRAIWETMTSYINEAPGIHLYMRANLLDQSFLPNCPYGVANPFDPAEQVHHYQSVDIKLDAQQPGSAAVAPYFQTDPEATFPLSHVFFNQLNDNSQALPSASPAFVHAQLHNRGSVKANNVSVWAIYCNASAGVPGLNVSAANGNAFAFWTQFTPFGTIIPNLPGDSPWRSIGPPQILQGVDPANPQVASWLWTAPTLPSGVDSGHYCIAVFVHSFASPINESSMSVDDIAVRNRQVAQKNLHIVPALDPGGSGGGGAGGGGGAPGSGTGSGAGIPADRPASFIEFHNPVAAQRTVSLEFDFSRLPAAIRTQVQFSTGLQLSQPLNQSVVGTDVIVRLPTTLRGYDRIGWLLRLLLWILRLIIRLINWIFGTHIQLRWASAGQSPLRFIPNGLVSHGSRRVNVNGVRLGAYQSVTARMWFENTGVLEEGTEYRFDVVQLAGGREVGGSTFVLPVRGLKKKGPEDPVNQLDENWSNDENLKHVFLPPHVKDVVEKARKESGKYE